MEKGDLKEIKKGHVGTGILIEHDGYISMDNGNNKQLKEDIGRDGSWNVPRQFIVDAVFQKFGIKNANGRIYPENILRREVERYMERINEHRALGELNHPNETTIDLGRISHNIIELHWEGRTLVGKMELNLTEGFRRHGIVSTMGDMAANLLLNGYKIGVSSRGVGSVENKMGQMIVGDDFELVCWDIVSEPSTPNAWISSSYEGLKPYMESVQADKNQTVISEKINKIRNILK